MPVVLQNKDKNILMITLMNQGNDNSKLTDDEATVKLLAMGAGEKCDDDTDVGCF